MTDYLNTVALNGSPEILTGWDESQAAREGGGRQWHSVCAWVNKGEVIAVIDESILDATEMMPKVCVKCGDRLMSGLTDTCYACNQVPAQQANEPKLPEYFAQYEYAPDFSVIVSVYQRRPNATPILIHSEALPKQIGEPAQQAQTESAEYWHKLYADKCQQLHDEKSRLGAEIEALELVAVVNAAVQKAYEPTLIAQYDKAYAATHGSYRQWHSAGAWLYGGDAIAVISGATKKG